MSLLFPASPEAEHWAEKKEREFTEKAQCDLNYCLALLLESLRFLQFSAHQVPDSAEIILKAIWSSTENSDPFAI